MQRSCGVRSEEPTLCGKRKGWGTLKNFRAGSNEGAAIEASGTGRSEREFVVGEHEFRRV